MTTPAKLLPEIKPCPLCNGKSHYASTGIGGKIVLGCFKCKLFLRPHLLKTAIKIWNTRPPAPARLEECPECDGLGWVERPVEGSPMQVDCDECHGMGKVPPSILSPSDMEEAVKVMARACRYGASNSKNAKAMLTALMSKFTLVKKEGV